MADPDRPGDPVESSLNATYCATLVDEWVRSGVTSAVMSPGSRSTPMALALARRPELSVHVHPDERSAAFIALGIGLASGRPAVVLTTSGTAAVELHPAVVEAHQAAVPVLVVTADRPTELHQVGAPQTVDQNRLFGGSVRWFADPGPPSTQAMASWRSLASRAVVEALGGSGAPGPVHLNLAFREPLVGEARELPPGRAGGRPWHATARAGREMAPEVGAVLADLPAERGVVVAGAGAGEPEDVIAMAESLGWPVLADPRSGCRVGHPLVVTAADALLRVDRVAAALRPDRVLRLGEPPASRVVSEWLATSGATQVAVERHGRWFDPDRTASALLHVEPGDVARWLTGSVVEPAATAWSKLWAELQLAASTAITATLDGADGAAASGPPTEPWVARSVLHAVSASAEEHGRANLVVSSSMPVRDLEWYGGDTGAVRVLANRGANGIDGVVSTALGVALAERQAADSRAVPTVVLVGDLAFLHDTNAMVALAARDVSFTVVVVDNDGGGIFSFLPQGRELDGDEFETLFGTPHGADLAGLARAHNLAVTVPEAEDGTAAVARAVADAVDRPGTDVVVVRTDRQVNVAAHEHLHRAVRQAVVPLVEGPGVGP